MSDDLLGALVKVCHKKGKVTDVRDRSCTVAIEIGSVHQDIVVTKEYARENEVDK